VPTTCRALKVAVRTRVFQHFFSIRRCLTCLSSIDLLGLQSICSPVSSPVAVHLQSTCSCSAVPLQSICSSPAVHLPVLLAVHLLVLLAVHLPVLLAVHLPVHFSSPAAVLCSTSALGAKLESLSPTPRSLGGPLLLTVKLELPSPSTRVLHQSSILGCCLSHSSTLHRQLTPSCSDDHLHTPTSYSRG